MDVTGLDDTDDDDSGGGGDAGYVWVTEVTFTNADTGAVLATVDINDGGALADATSGDLGSFTAPAGTTNFSIGATTGNVYYCSSGPSGIGADGLEYVTSLDVNSGFNVYGSSLAGPEGQPYQIASSTGQVAAPTAWRPFSGSATHYNIKNGRTAWSQPFNPNCMCAATYQKGIPKNGQATVTLQNDPSKSINVIVNDTGPFERGPDNRPLVPLRADPNTVIDLTDTAFRALSGGGLGIGRLDVTVTPR